MTDQYIPQAKTDALYDLGKNLFMHLNHVFGQKGFSDPADLMRVVEVFLFISVSAMADLNRGNYADKQLLAQELLNTLRAEAGNSVTMFLESKYRSGQDDQDVA